MNAYTDFHQLDAPLDRRQRRKTDGVTATTTISDSDRAVIFAEMAKAVNRLAGTVTADRYKVDVLRFIADRTFGFQKLSEVILERHFLKGVQSTAKGVTCAGLGMSAAKLYACLHWARQQGIVVTKKAKRKVRYAIKLEWLLALVSPMTRDKIAPALTLTDNEWGAEEPREYLHAMEVSSPRYLHEVEVHLKNHSPYVVREEESSARELAPDAGPGASLFSGREEGAHAPVEAAPAVAPATPPAAKDAPSTSIQADRPAPPPVTLAKRGRIPRELWASTLVDRFDAAFRQFWPGVELPVAPSGKLRGQWENFSRRWRRADITVADWVAWSVENWRGVYVTVFQHVEDRQEREAKKLAEAPWAPKSHWRTRMDCPEYPDLGFLLRYERAFQESYDRRASQKIRAGLTREDELVRRFMFSGYSHADALAEAHEIMAKDKVREDLVALTAELNAKARNLEAEKQAPEYRLAVARIRSGKDPEATWVKPVALAKPRLKPTFAYANGDAVAPLPAIPVWRDDPDEACAA